MLVALEVKEEQEKLAAASEPENEEEKDDKDEQDKELEQKLAAIEQAIAKNNVKLNKLEQDYHKDDEKAEALNKEWDTAFAKDLKDMTAFEKAITHGEEDELSKDEKKKLKDHYKLLGRRSENNYSAINLAEDNMAKRAEERAAIEKDLERIKEQDPENYQDNAKVKNLHKQLEALEKEDQKDQQFINKRNKDVKKSDDDRKSQLKNVKGKIEQGKYSSIESKREVKKHIGHFAPQYRQMVKEKEQGKTPEKRQAAQKEHDKLLKLVKNVGLEKELGVEGNELKVENIEKAKKRSRLQQIKEAVKDRVGGKDAEREIDRAKQDNKKVNFEKEKAARAARKQAAAGRKEADVKIAAATTVSPEKTPNVVKKAADATKTVELAKKKEKATSSLQKEPEKQAVKQKEPGNDLKDIGNNQVREWKNAKVSKIEIGRNKEQQPKLVKDGPDKQQIKERSASSLKDIGNDQVREWKNAKVPKTERGKNKEQQPKLAKDGPDKQQIKERPASSLKDIANNQVKPSIKEQKTVQAVKEEARKPIAVEPKQEKVEIVAEKEVKKPSLTQRAMQATARLVIDAIKFVGSALLAPKSQPAIAGVSTANAVSVSKTGSESKTMSHIRALLEEGRSNPNHAKNTHKINKMIVGGKYVQPSGYKGIGSDGQKLDRERLEAEIKADKKAIKEKLTKEQAKKREEEKAKNKKSSEKKESKESKDVKNVKDDKKNTSIKPKQDQDQKDVKSGKKQKSSKSEYESRMRTNIEQAKEDKKKGQDKGK